MDSLPIRFFILYGGITISDSMINEQIRDKEVRLIGKNGEQLGIMSSRDALELARKEDLDLVKVAPNAKPPVCKIIDYGKYRYEMARKEKEAKKKQRTFEVKEIRMFLTKGNKVKVTLRFKGREMAHISTTSHILTDFAETLSDISTIEKAPKLEGRSISMVLAPVTAKKK